jgi:hypothetical protein
MIKPKLIFTLLFLTLACTKEPETAGFSDDYVLIEFAARLEEDHQRLHPEPLENPSQKTTE